MNFDNIQRTVFHITFALFADDPPATHQQVPTQVSEVDTLNQGVVENDVISPGEELFKNEKDECQRWQQRPALQLNKVYTFNLPLSL